MAARLKDYFPMLYEREELLGEIRAVPALDQKFRSWAPRRQQQFLDLCTGVRGVKLLYDSFFKEVMNPEYAPQRLERFLSLLLGTEVRIRAVLPGDSTRIAAESSLLAMDLVVELSGGALVNIEVQKVGYAFPGQRAACYSSDLLLRQYRRVRDAEKRRFSYAQVQGVCTVVLIERSTKEFHRFPGQYLHRFRQASDTGLELPLLQEYLFIPLDIFGALVHNNGIRNETEAWLAFLSQDDPETVVRLAEEYPQFRPMYEEAYRICRNVEGMMEIFSEELRILDENTVQYMIDEMQAEIDSQKAALELSEARLREKDTQLWEKDHQIQEKDTQIQEKDTQIREETSERHRLEQRVAELERLLGEQTDAGK